MSKCVTCPNVIHRTLCPSSKLVVLTGASGAGKTTITKRIAAEAPAAIVCLYFDSIGVPSPEQMVAEFGSVEDWQRAKTFEWIERIRKEYLSKGKSVLFDGQTRISFALDACRATGITNYEVVLVDCDDFSRENRVRVNRRQPELANERMMNWARFLRSEAEASGVPILDTSGDSIDACVSRILVVLGS